MRSERRIALLCALAGIAALGGCASRSAAPPRVMLPAIGLETEVIGAPRTATGPLFLILSDRPDTASREPERAAARALVAAIPGSIAYLVLRPGHAGAEGRMSPGDAGQGNADALDRARIDQIAAAIDAIERRYPKLTPVLIGQGLGAAAAANVAGTHPRLVRGLALAACACTLPEYRAEQAGRHGAAWKQPVASLDPLQTVGGISPSTRVVLVVGDADPDFRPRYSRTYAEGLALRGISTELRIVPGARGNLYATPEWSEAVTRLVTTLKERP